VLTRTPLDSQFDRVSRIDGSAATVTLGPVPHGARASGLTYEPFYGLTEKPFSLRPDSRFFYHSRSHAPAFDDLLAGIRRRESLNVLTGDIGTGKTTLCRAVLQNLDRKTFSAFVPDPFASRVDLLKVLLMDFGVLSVEDLTSGRLKDASRTELSYLLSEFLDTLAPLQAFAVVIIDEAQNLSVPLLEEIRILTDADGPLQVVLVGQLELRDKLKLPEMRQVDQRVSVHCHLAPLACDGVAGYIAHRLQTAGGSPDRVKFSPEASEVLYRVSGGVPRLINRLSDRALHQGYLRRAATIDMAMVEAAMADVVMLSAAASVVKPSAVARVKRRRPRTPVSAAPPAVVAPSAPAASALVTESVAAQATIPASTAPPVPQQIHDLVEAWIVAIDEKSDDALLCSPDTRNRNPSIPAQPPAATDGEPVNFRPRFVPPPRAPRSRMEKFLRRWLRRFGTARPDPSSAVPPASSR
jgi:type II secretory pathway predicted ATPase ExeA